MIFKSRKKREGPDSRKKPARGKLAKRVGVAILALEGLMLAAGCGTNANIGENANNIPDSGQMDSEVEDAGTIRYHMPTHEIPRINLNIKDAEVEQDAEEIDAGPSCNPIITNNYSITLQINQPLEEKGLTFEYVEYLEGGGPFPDKVTVSVNCHENPPQEAVIANSTVIVTVDSTNGNSYDISLEPPSYSNENEVTLSISVAENSN